MIQRDIPITGIGSVPFLDVSETCLMIAREFPHIPFWPQMVKVSPKEQMMLQFLEGIPFLSIKEDNGGSITISDQELEPLLVRFYEAILRNDFQPFRISPGFAVGLYRLVDILKDRPGAYIKGQIVGPITLGLGIKFHDGKALIHNPELFEAILEAIGHKALWQINFMATTHRRPILFLDEPGLSGFGSAFSALQRQEVIEALFRIKQKIKDGSNALVGIHCCGNTDWGMLFETGIDIISFDAYGFMEQFMLYKGHITQFMERGGWLAWGIVPTDKESLTVELSSILDRWKEGIERLRAMGISKDKIISQSILTPSCGMGSLSEKDAIAVIRLLKELKACIDNEP